MTAITRNWSIDCIIVSTISLPNFLYCVVPVNPVIFFFNIMRSKCSFAAASLAPKPNSRKYFPLTPFKHLQATTADLPPTNVCNKSLSRSLLIFEKHLLTSALIKYNFLPENSLFFNQIYLGLDSFVSKDILSTYELLYEVINCIIIFNKWDKPMILLFSFPR